MEELSFKLGADGSELPPELEKAKKGFKKFANDVTEELAKAGAAAGKSGQSAKAAGIQFQGFSRVMQDAAFGPAAIANNLEALGRDMQQISQISKDTGQSIGKTLVASLMGGGGLNLAIGGLTLALSLASFGMSAWTRLFPKSADEVDKTKKKVLEYVETLDAVRQAQLTGSQEAAKELTTLKLLYAQYANGNLPLEQRQRAYKQIQDQYPAYFGNLKFEEQVTVKTAGAYDKLTQAIIASARAAAARDLITKKETRRLENEQKIIDLQTEQLKNQGTLDKINARPVQRAAASAGVGAAQGIGVARDRAAAEEKVNENLAKQRNLATDLILLDKQMLQLTKSFNEEAAKGGTLIDPVKAAAEGVTKYLPKFKAGIGDMVSILRPLMDTSKTSTDEGLVGRMGARAAKGTLMETVTLLEQTLLEMKTRAAAAYTDFVNTIGLNLSRTFGNFFADIVTQGKLSFKTLADGILGEFKRILANAITKKLLSLFVNFASGGGAGIFGKIFSFLGGGTGIPGFASGVQNFSGGLALVGENGPELVNLPGGSDVIPGGRFGTGSTQVFISKTQIRAGDIYISYEKGARINRRVT